jgi:hypothetical protein
MNETAPENPGPEAPSNARGQWKPRAARLVTAATAALAVGVALAQPALAGPSCGC